MWIARLRALKTIDLDGKPRVGCGSVKGKKRKIISFSGMTLQRDQLVNIVLGMQPMSYRKLDIW